MTARPVEHDERTLAVQNAGYRLAYHLVVFGLLGSIAWRGFARDETSWDLFGLILASGFAATFVQARGRTIGRRWLMLATLALVVGAGLALVAWRLAR